MWVHGCVVAVKRGGSGCAPAGGAVRDARRAVMWMPDWGMICDLWGRSVQYRIGLEVHWYGAVNVLRECVERFGSVQRRGHRHRWPVEARGSSSHRCQARNERPSSSSARNLTSSANKDTLAPQRQPSIAPLTAQTKQPPASPLSQRSTACTRKVSPIWCSAPAPAPPRQYCV